MKNFLTLAVILTLGVGSLNGQVDEQKLASINDFNFESVTNPAFMLLEETPTAISTPNNLKALALYLSNGFSNSNIAVELNPYWVLGWDTDNSYKKYRGIEGEKGQERISPIKGLETGWSFSLGYIDKQFESFDDNRKVFALGARTTILQLYGRERTQQVLDVVANVEGPFSNTTLEKFDLFVRAPVRGLLTPGPDEYGPFVEDGTISEEYKEAAKQFYDQDERAKSRYASADELVVGYFTECANTANAFIYNTKNIKPILRVDGAVAYSYLFKENDINAATANRFASWLTADAAIQFNDQKYLHVLAIGKYVEDGFILDDQGVFSKEIFWDYGAKIELELERFKLSYEHLRRSGFDDQFRSVGNITYQLNKNMSLTGGFGKDFPLDDNLISIIGINWGLNSGEDGFKKAN